MIVFGTALISLISAIDPQCQAAIDANAQSLDLIRTIQITSDIVSIKDPTAVVCEVSWSRDGRKERIGRVSKTNVKASVDVVLDGDTSKALFNWFPETRITPTNQNGVGAQIGPRTGFAVAGLSPALQLRFEVDVSPRRTLSELAKVSPTVTCKGKVTLDGRDLWLINLETPEETTKTTSKQRFDVYLDPSVGYLIRKIVVHSDDLLPNGKIETYSHAHEVLEFRDFGDGVFVPTLIRNGDLGAWQTNVVVTSVKVNEPIPPETFEMIWPKFVLVMSPPAANGDARYEVWGDGKPLRAFQGNADLQAFEAELRRDPRLAAELDANLLAMEAIPGASSWLLRINVAIAVGVVLLMVALAVRRQRMARSA